MTIAAVAFKTLELCIASPAPLSSFVVQHSMSLYANQATGAKGAQRSNPGTPPGSAAAKAGAAAMGASWDNDSETWEDIEAAGKGAVAGNGAGTTPKPKKEKSFLDDW